MCPPGTGGAEDTGLGKTERNIFPGLCQVPPCGPASGSFLVLFDSPGNLHFPCVFHSRCFPSHTIKRSLTSTNSYFRITSFHGVWGLGYRLISHWKFCSFSQALALSLSAETSGDVGVSPGNSEDVNLARPLASMTLSFLTCKNKEIN